MLTSEQIRAARALLRMEQITLAERAGVGSDTIKRLERQDGPVRAQAGTIAAIRSALESAGVEFTDDNMGVGLRADPQAAIKKAILEEANRIFEMLLRTEIEQHPDILVKDKSKAFETIQTMISSSLVMGIHEIIYGGTDDDPE